jgi:hypothetical protein
MPHKFQIGQRFRRCLRLHQVSCGGSREQTKGELSGCRLCPLSSVTICSVRSGLVEKKGGGGTRHLLKPPPVNPSHGWFYLARGDAMRRSLLTSKALEFKRKH